MVVFFKLRHSISNIPDKETELHCKLGEYLLRTPSNPLRYIKKKCKAYTAKKKKGRTLQFCQTANAYEKAPAKHSFEHFVRLPTEIQTYILSYCSIKDLLRSVAPANQSMSFLVYNYVKIEVTKFILASDTQKNIMFRAQRPIEEGKYEHCVQFSRVVFRTAQEWVRSQDSNHLGCKGVPFVEFSFEKVSKGVTSSQQEQDTMSRGEVWKEKEERSPECISATSESDRTDVTDSTEEVQLDLLEEKGQGLPVMSIQLSPIDSFESLIMSLSLQYPLVDTGETKNEKTGGTKETCIVHGLDRVFRDWFRTSDGVKSGLQSINLRQESTPSSMKTEENLPKSSHVSMYPSRSPYSHPDAIIGNSSSHLASQTLRFDDGTGSVVTIQPQKSITEELHPALSSLPSHYYLSLPPSTQRTRHQEYTFCYKSISINAARLLHALREIEDSKY